MQLQPSRKTEYLNARTYLFGLVRRVMIPAPDGTDYLRRWQINLPFGFAIYFHKIFQSDGDRDLHDHPWDFLSILVWGNYIETTPGRNYRLKKWFNFHWAEDLHQLTLFKKNGVEQPVYTIILRGRRKRDWGFMTRYGWVRWDVYNRQKIGNELV